MASSKCHHGTVILDSWMECSKCCAEHDAAETNDLLREQNEILKGRKDYSYNSSYNNSSKSYSSETSSIQCPKCKSYQIGSSKQGYSVGKALVGFAFLGPIGPIAGFLGKNKIKVTCLKCGHTWKAGKA